MTPSHRHAAHLAANENVRLCFSITFGFIIGCAAIAAVAYCVHLYETELDETFDNFGLPSQDEKTARKGRHSESVKTQRAIDTATAELAYYKVLKARRVTMEELRALEYAKSEAAA